MRGTLAFLFIFSFAPSKEDADITTAINDIKDLLNNSMESEVHGVENVSFPTEAYDYDIGSRPFFPPDFYINLYTVPVCPDSKVLASKYSKKTNTSSTSDHISTSATDFDLEISKTVMKEFLKKYKQLNYTDIEGCYNDTKCGYFGDCCPYKDQYSTEKTYNSYKCIPIRTDHFSVDDYLLVAKCLPYFKSDATTKDKCEQYSGHKYPPVISNGVGRFYRNEFCAKCNDDWNFTKWTTEIVVDNPNWFDEIARIRNSLDVAEFMKNYIQNIIFKVPFGMDEPWSCDSQYPYIDTCNLTGELLLIEPWEEFGCRSYTDPVDYYRNTVCKTCNERRNCEDPPRSNGVGPDSFGALMDLESLRKYEEYLKEEEKKTLCQSDEFYDYLNKRCRRLECSFGFYMNPNSTCSQILTSACRIPYKIHFSLIPLRDLTEKEANLFKKNFWDTAQADSRSMQPLITFKYRLNNQTHHPSLVEKILFYIYFERTGTEAFTKMEKYIESWISEIKRMPFSNFFRIVKDFESLKISRDYFLGKLLDRSLYKSVLLQISSTFSLHRSILYSEIRECTKVRLFPDEFTFNKNKSEIIVNVRRVSLTMDRVEFYPNGTAMICLSDYPGTFSIVEPHVADFVEIVLSKVFISISLSCLVLTLTAYAIFPRLRTLPGKCNIFLCCTLFVAQALFLVKSFDDETACAVIGTIRHFAWLSTFGWMSICSFHMYRVFTRFLGGGGTGTKTNKTIARYALIAYGLPLLVVSSTITANMVLYGVTVTGYGPPNCYLSKQLQLILAFALPLSLMIIFNTSLLSITIYSLYKTTKECNIVNRDRQRVLVYLKLSSLTGITWVFGFLSMSIPNKWFNCLFIIINASQGIYIFLSYTLNSNVLKLFNEKFTCFHTSSKRQEYTDVFTTQTTNV